MIEVKLTGRPEDALALRVKGGSAGGVGQRGKGDDLVGCVAASEVALAVRVNGASPIFLSGSAPNAMLWLAGSTANDCAT